MVGLPNAVDLRACHTFDWFPVPGYRLRDSLKAKDSFDILKLNVIVMRFTV